jgi:hypothetical protein
MDPLDILKGMRGVKHAFYLDDDLLQELKAEEATVRSTMDIGVVNEGFNQALERDKVVCIVKDARFRPPPEPTVILRGDNGLLLGVEVFPHTANEYKDRTDVIWLSDGFIVFPEVRAEKSECFVMPPVSFPELNPENGCHDVVSCSPSPTSDVMIRKRYGMKDDPKLASILVAYNL